MHKSDVTEYSPKCGRQTKQRCPCQTNPSDRKYLSNVMVLFEHQNIIGHIQYSKEIFDCKNRYI